MEITVAQIKELREASGAGVLDTRDALRQSDGDIDKAMIYLREKGLVAAAKKEGRVASDGVIGSYVHHNNRVAVIVEVNSETDFVARTEEFQTLGQDLAMHIAMANPRYLDTKDVPQEVLDGERAIYRKEAEATGKPAEIIEKIIEGKINKFYDEVCLLRQPFIKDDKVSIGDMIRLSISRLGENIVIHRFARFALGEE